jgi:hypothetical protein
MKKSRAARIRELEDIVLELRLMVMRQNLEYVKKYFNDGKGLT